MSIKPFLQLILRLLRYVHALAGGAFILLIIVLSMSATCFTVYQVDGHSMMTTLQNGQLLAVNLLAFKTTDPKVGDVVIVRYKGDPSIRFVKRVEAVPGMTVNFQGQALVLGSDQFFVEGDNRDFSTDSRVYGPVSRSNIVGAVMGLAAVDHGLQ